MDIKIKNSTSLTTQEIIGVIYNSFVLNNKVKSKVVYRFNTSKDKVIFASIRENKKSFTFNFWE